jgi:L-seryl-tRNA(Ser) seleniumtransferase
MEEADVHERLRTLPSVDELLRTEPLRSAAGRAPQSLALTAAREAIERGRAEIKRGHNGERSAEELARDAVDDLDRAMRPSMRRVVNATGVVVHTNLGRAPLAEEALQAIERVVGYSNLEYELEAGERGSRHVHVEELLCDLTGAEAAFAVNNNAAAVMLALAALVHGRDVVISRGQLVEIGGSFRVPDILAASGGQLVEVGTTNRTRRADYERAIGATTAALMRVHASNFRSVGFTEEVGIEELCSLAREHDLLVIDDLGSGVLARDGDAAMTALLADEPDARASVAAGADVVCFSGDKLLGGPQAGIVAGRADAVERMRSHPVARAVRIDKFSLAALEATLRLHRDPARAARELPVLRMLAAPEQELSGRADRLRQRLAEMVGESAHVEVVRSSGRVGGGALPLLELEGPVVGVKPSALGVEELQEALRRHEPPVVTRVKDDAVLLDPRTMSDAEADIAAVAIAVALRP